MTRTGPTSKGRSAGFNPGNRFASTTVELLEEERDPGRNILSGNSDQLHFGFKQE